MAFANLQLPTFPFVPAMPGVPALLRAPVDSQAPALLTQALTTGVTPALLTSMLSGAVPSMLNGVTAPLSQLAGILSPSVATSDIASQVTGASPAPQWGIFDSGGNQVVTPDSVVSLDWDGASHVIKAPIEDGNFESYNKVQTPFETRVVMRKGGTISDRQSFINALDGIRNDLNLYTVVSPEISYPNVNITHVSYARRADAGATVYEATITLEQINVSASSSFTNVQSPTSQDAFNGGTVDAQTPSSSQATVASGGPA